MNKHTLKHKRPCIHVFAYYSAGAIILQPHRHTDIYDARITSKPQGTRMSRKLGILVCVPAFDQSHAPCAF